MNPDRLYICVLVALAAPFYLNDLANIHVADWRWWLTIDYVGLKVYPLLLIGWLIHGGRMQATEFGLVAQSPSRFVITFALVALSATLVDQNAYRLIAGWPGYEALGAMPPITSRAWDRFDLSVGLLLVALLEELVFRAYMSAFLERYTRSGTVIVLVSAIAFGLIHWSLGLHAVLITALIGALFMAVYLHTRSLPAIVLAHFAVNFVDFAGVIPKSMFQFAAGS